jgi:hypothetical protein
MLSVGDHGGLRRKQLLSDDRNGILRIREPDLTKLRDLPRAEAMRIAMIKHGWDAATAAEKVDIEQGCYAEEMAGRTKSQSAKSVCHSRWAVAGTHPSMIAA